MAYIIYKLWAHIYQTKTNSQIRKEKLWKLSVWLVTSLAALSLVILIQSFEIKYYSIGDSIMDVIIIAAIIINFMQWRENVNVYIYKRFIQPLMITYYKEKHIFSTRIEALASKCLSIILNITFLLDCIIKQCGDSDSAVYLVKEGRIVAAKVFDD
jgi:hypothetical protein